MCNALRNSLIVALSILTVSSVCAAGKITADPNSTPKATTKAISELTDKRLDQKITYDAGNARLYKVIADLSEVSSITIHCGSSSDDWRVRDIPVTVAARDITLRELLNYLVYSTHTVLKTTKVKDEVVYRITQDPKIEKAAADYKKALEEAAKAHSEWSWNVAGKLKDIPASEIKPPANAGTTWAEDLNAQIEVSKLLSAIDPKMRDSILASEPTLLTPATAPAGLRGSLLSVIRAADTQSVRFAEHMNSDKSNTEKYGATYNADPASPDQLEAGRIELKEGWITVNTGASMSADHNLPRSQHYYAWKMAETVVRNNNGRFKLPEEPVAPKRPETIAPNGLIAIHKDTPGLPEKVTIKLEDDKKPKWSSDAMIALSKATGITIVYEDFQSHYEYDVRDEFKTERLLADVLKKSGWDMNWQHNAPGKALVGYSGNWFGEHEYLIPERLVNELAAKANGDGIYLEDLMPLAAYPPLALSAWLRTGVFEGLPTSAFQSEYGKTWWRFYDALPAESKELAKSDAGLKLAGYDPKLIGKMILVDAKINDKYYDPDGPVFKSKRLADPSVAPTTVMHVVSTKAYGGLSLRFGNFPSAQPSESDNAEPTDPAKPIRIPPGFTDRYYYHMTVEGIADGDKLTINTGAFENILPFFSPKREKELAAALKKQTEAEQAQSIE